MIKKPDKSIPGEDFLLQSVKDGNDRFLLDTVPMICDYVLMNSKKKDK